MVHRTMKLPARHSLPPGLARAVLSVLLAFSAGAALAKESEECEFQIAEDDRNIEECRIVVEGPDDRTPESEVPTLLVAPANEMGIRLCGEWQSTSSPLQSMAFAELRIRRDNSNSEAVLALSVARIQGQPRLILDWISAPLGAWSLSDPLDPMPASPAANLTLVDCKEGPEPHAGEDFRVAVANDRVEFFEGGNRVFSGLVPPATSPYSNTLLYSLKVKALRVENLNSQTRVRTVWRRRL